MEIHFDWIDGAEYAWFYGVIFVSAMLVFSGQNETKKIVVVRSGPIKSLNILQQK